MEYAISENSHLPVLTNQQLEDSPMAEAMFKADIPAAFDGSTNGEGCWFFPLTQGDKDVYDTASYKPPLSLDLYG